jgi:hypothetical protein
MSIDRCHNCDFMVDTDVDLDCYGLWDGCLCIRCRKQNDEQLDVEQDIKTIEQVAEYLLAAYRRPIGHRIISDNAKRIEEAADKLALLLEKLRSASTARVIEIKEYA